jgi:hypothetical protein
VPGPRHLVALPPHVDAARGNVAQREIRAGPVLEHPEVAAPRFLLAAAAFHERTGDGHGAIGLYDRVVDAVPHSEEGFLALVRSADVLWRAGDGRRAPAVPAGAGSPRLRGPLAGEDRRAAGPDGGVIPAGGPARPALDALPLFR